MSDFGQTRSVVARKHHRCAWCGVRIEQGETYRRFQGRWDDTWQNWGMHVECLAFSQNYIGDGFQLYDNDIPGALADRLGIPDDMREECCCYA